MVRLLHGKKMKTSFILITIACKSFRKLMVLYSPFFLTVNNVAGFAQNLALNNLIPRKEFIQPCMCQKKITLNLFRQAQAAALKN